MKFITTDKIPEMPAGYLFNAPGFHALKEVKPLVYALEDNGQTVARLVFYQLENEVVSGYEAPFGSVDSSIALKSAELKLFLENVLHDLRKRELKEIYIKTPPAVFFNSLPVEGALLDLGFKVTSVEQNQHLPVDRSAFEQRISQKERNKYNRARKEGYAFGLLDQAQTAQAFELINETYGRKNYPVTLSEAKLGEAMNSLPGRYFLFGLYDNNRLIAVVASVRVSEELLYNFYHADHAGYRSRSPLVMLIGETYRYCQDNGYKILDLGISSVAGKINQGLFRFKENLGCQVSEKKTFQLILAQ